MAVCITHPIDQTKIRSQTQKVRQNVLDTARASIRHGGITGLWTGLSASLLRQCTYGAARFGIYAWLKEKNPGVPLWVNGAAAGLVAGVVGAPAGELAIPL
jgi:dicarboxylate transporter 10